MAETNSAGIPILFASDNTRDTEMVQKLLGEVLWKIIIASNPGKAQQDSSITISLLC